MIREVQFKNFKVLRDASLPLGRFTLVLGPNGSGKSTVFQALAGAWKSGSVQYERVFSAGAPSSPESEAVVRVAFFWDAPLNGVTTEVIWRSPGGADRNSFRGPLPGPRYSVEASVQGEIDRLLAGIRVFSLDATALLSAVQLAPHMELGGNGSMLAGVLDRLRDEHPERFESVNRELARWVPEFDRILFETPGHGLRAIRLRTKEGGHAIAASELSQGTLLALALLTLAYLPTPPSLVCLEEPDRGIHPRLLRDVVDVLYRLSHPESAGEKRSPVQVIATTHSPYLLDLFRDHPEEIVLAQKEGLSARFERLSDRKDLPDLVRDAHLSEIWYSGLLGAVPDGK